MEQQNVSTTKNQETLIVIKKKKPTRSFVKLGGNPRKSKQPTYKEITEVKETKPLEVKKEEEKETKVESLFEIQVPEQQEQIPLSFMVPNLIRKKSKKITLNEEPVNIKKVLKQESEVDNDIEAQYQEQLRIAQENPNYEENKKKIAEEIGVIMSSMIKYYSPDSNTGVTIKEILQERKKQGGKFIDIKEFLSQKESDNNTKYISLLQTPPAQDKVWDLDFNSIRSSLEGAGVKGIRITNPVLVPKLSEIKIKVYDEEVHSNKINLGTIGLSTDTEKEEAGTHTMLIPFPDLQTYWTTGKLGGFYPNYAPHYFKAKYDKGLLGAIRAAVQTSWTLLKQPELKSDFFSDLDVDPLNLEEQYTWYSELVGVAKNNFFGNGSLVGQIGRWKACVKVNNFLKEQKLKENYFMVTPDTLNTFLRKRIYTHPLLEIPNSKNLDYIEISDYLENHGFRGIQITKEAGDGLLYPDKTKVDTILSDILLSKLFLKDVDRIKEEPFNEWLEQKMKQQVKPKFFEYLETYKLKQNVSARTEFVKECIKEYSKDHTISEEDKNILDSFLFSNAELIYANRYSTFNWDEEEEVDLSNVREKEEDEGIGFGYQDKPLPPSGISSFVGYSPGQFWRKWFFLREAKMKPKAEVYQVGLDNPEDKNSEKKTRNYWEANFTPFLPFVALLNWYLAGKENPNTSVENHCLTGWVPSAGGIHNLLMRVCKRFNEAVNRFKPEELPGLVIDWFIFCDNLFICQINEEGTDWTWFSLDGSKMEATVDKDFVTTTCNMLRLVFQGKISDTLDKYLRYVVPDIVAGMYSVLGNVVFPMPFMTSGSVGTSFFNNVKMALVMFSVLKQCFKNGKLYDIMTPDFKLSNKALDAVSRTGVILKVERYQPFVILNMTEQKYLDLDLLGYGGIPIKLFFEGVDLVGTTRVFAHLAKERMNNMLLFMKLDSKQSELQVLGASRHLIVRLLKLKLAYIYGGFSDLNKAKLLSLAHKITLGNLYTYGQEANIITTRFEDYSDFIGEAYEEIGMQTVLNSLAEINMPSILTVIRLNLGEAEFKDIFKQIYDKGLLIKYIEKRLVSPMDVENYLGKDEIKKYFKDLIPAPSFALLKPMDVHSILKLLEIYKTASFPQQIVLRKFKDINKTKALVTESLVDIPFLSLEQQWNPLSLQQYASFFTSFKEMYYGSRKIVLNTVQFTIHTPIPHIIPIIYSIFCYYLATCAKIGFKIAMKVTRDFALSAFVSDELFVLLAQIIKVDSTGHIQFQEVDYRLINDITIRKIPEFAYIFYNKIVHDVYTLKLTSFKEMHLFTLFPFDLGDEKLIYLIKVVSPSEMKAWLTVIKNKWSLPKEFIEENINLNYLDVVKKLMVMFYSDLREKSKNVDEKCKIFIDSRIKFFQNFDKEQPADLDSFDKGSHLYNKFASNQILFCESFNNVKKYLDDSIGLDDFKKVISDNSYKEVENLEKAKSKINSLKQIFGL